MSERMKEAKLSSLRINNVELSEIAVIYEKSQVLNRQFMPDFLVDAENFLGQ